MGNCCGKDFVDGNEAQHEVDTLESQLRDGQRIERINIQDLNIADFRQQAEQINGQKQKALGIAQIPFREGVGGGRGTEFKDPNCLDSVERYNVVYRKPENQIDNQEM